MSRPISFKREDSRKRAKQIKDALKKKPRTSNALVFELDINKTIINNYLRSLIASHKVYISGWTYISEVDKTEREIARPIYSVGNKPNVQKPAPKTAKQIMHEYHVRTMTQPDKYPKAVEVRRKRKLFGRIERLTERLKEQPAANPIEAMVSAILVPGRRKND